MSDSPQRALVIGAGVIGTACAWFLRQAGLEVTVVDRNTIGSGCSFENCGYVCPSHVLPLTRPGVITTTLKAMMKSRSPLYVNPFVGPRLWRWLWQFSRHCRHDHMIEAGSARYALLQSSQDLYRQLIREQDLDCDWHERGLLVVYEDAHGLDAAHKENELLERHWGVSADPLDGPGLVDLEPTLKEGLAGGMHFTEDTHLDPGRLMRSWRALNEAHGVTYREQCPVTGFKRDGDRVIAADTPDGPIEADTFVLATGALAPELGRQLGRQLAIQPGKGYSLTTERPDPCPQVPMIFHDHRVAVTPLSERYRLGSTMEFSGYDTSLNPRRLALLEEGAARYLDMPRGETILSRWYGWRPMSATGLPVITLSPNCPNVCLAVGHSMVGTSMAPGTGRLVAELVTGAQPHVDPAPYA
ncbi:MAG: FAD-dependent oxidoreductase [Phycisphaeraceae bacterium]|nr:FAD-dependent oxidoreductase [Phycisphaeraceae bacterium]